MAPRRMLREIMSVPDVYTFAEPIMEMLREFYGAYDADVLDEVLVEEGFAQRLKSRGYEVRPWGEPITDGVGTSSGGEVPVMRHRRTGLGSRPGGAAPGGDRPTRIIRPVTPTGGGERPGFSAERGALPAQNVDRPRPQQTDRPGLVQNRDRPAQNMDRPTPRPMPERPAPVQSVTNAAPPTRPVGSDEERPVAAFRETPPIAPAPIEARPTASAEPPVQAAPVDVPAPAETPAPTATPTRGRRAGSATSSETPRAPRAAGTRTRAKAETPAEEAPAPRTRRTRTPRTSENGEA